MLNTDVIEKHIDMMIMFMQQTYVIRLYLE